MQHPILLRNTVRLRALDLVLEPFRLGEDLGGSTPFHPHLLVVIRRAGRRGFQVALHRGCAIAPAQVKPHRPPPPPACRGRTRRCRGPSSCTQVIDPLGSPARRRTLRHQLAAHPRPAAKHDGVEAVQGDHFTLSRQSVADSDPWTGLCRKWGFGARLFRRWRLRRSANTVGLRFVQVAANGWHC